MAELAQPTGVLARMLELIAEARTITLLNQDQDFIEKNTLLREYAEFSTMFPDRDYWPVIRKGTAELRAILQGVVTSEEIMVKNRMKTARVLKTREMSD
jgi:hypothetical protein